MSNFLFDTQNADGSTSLYATDGTTAGTVDLDMSSTFSLVDSPDYTTFDGNLYFIGKVPYDEGYYDQLYSTDGTATGTASVPVSPGYFMEPAGLWVLNGLLLEAGVGHAGAGGLYTNGLALESTQDVTAFSVSHGLGLFGGVSSYNGSTSLWRTDGTVAGTYVITPAGVTLNPTGLTSIGNGYTLFADQSASGGSTLWVTDGTAAGTHQVANAALGADVSLPGATTNGKAIFTAIDAADNISVWASDGTISGTLELAISGHNGDAVRTPGGFQAFGNDVVYTSGYGLVVTDGTINGTVHLPDTQFLQDYAVLGSKIIFTAANSATKLPGDGSMALFVSDGTGAGTHQIALPYGLDVDYTTIVIDGSQVVFKALNASGQEELYATDGTVSGTTELSVPAGDFTSSSDPLAALPSDAASISIVLTAGQSYTNTAAGDFLIQATGASIDMVAGNSTISGNANLITLGSGASQVSESTPGAGNTIIGSAGNLIVTGGNATVFGGAGNLVYSGGGGIQVLGTGNTTIAGGAAGTVSEIFGGTGTIDYAGQAEKGYVIGSEGSVSVIGGAGGGWYEGGTNGNNVISAGGIGTVLDAGASGDHLTGDANGWDYFLAGAGNVTLTGGNSSGTQFYFGGTGNATENLGTGTSTLVASTGAESINCGLNDSATIWLTATSGTTLTSAGTGGTATIVGFRAGQDHLHAVAVTSDTYSGGNSNFITSSGDHITLIGLNIGTAAAFI